MPKAMGEAQIVFLLLLSLARHPRRVEVDSAVAETLEAVAARVASNGTPPATDPQAALAALEDAIQRLRPAATATIGDDNVTDRYRSLVTALRHLSPPAPTTASASHARPATALALVHHRR